MALERNEVAKDDAWNVEALYSNFDAWQRDFQTIMNEKQEPNWKVLSSFQGRLGQGPDILKTCIEKMFEFSRHLSKLYTYAHLKHDEEITHDQNKGMYARAVDALHDFSQATSWFEPELIALPDETIHTYLGSAVLKDYRFYLEKIFRLKKHTLSHECEEIITLAGKAFQCPNKAYRAISDADFRFGTVLDGSGNRKEITHGSYGIYIRDYDRILRKNAFKQYHEKYIEFENSICELLNGELQIHVFNARSRKYNSCLEAALFPKNIDTEVYHALIDAVHKKIGTLHKYVELRKKILNLEELHIYDLYVPLSVHENISIPYQEAEDLVIESVAPLGPEYQNVLRKGLKEDRWVDRYENRNKRSGAYSSGSYDTMPYILMNYKNVLRDVFTLAHEAGHSMHTKLSHTHQPYQYADYPIFLAEVASTFNEELLIRLLLERAKTKEEKIYLINQKIEDIRATLFRQTMFAEFELKIHESSEQGIPLTPKFLKELYRKLNEYYFGTSIIIDSEIDIEWARISHFYYNFYVFQYATGLSAAMALADRVLHGGISERNDYLAFLKGGSSHYPIDMLKIAGVDMRTPDPVCNAINEFGNWITQLEKSGF